MTQALSADEFANSIKDNLPDNWHFKDEALRYKYNRLYIPESLRIKAKKVIHDNPLAGHQETVRTIYLAQRNYYWPNMINDIKEYVAGYQLCARKKSRTHKPYGKLKLLPTPGGK